MKTLRYGPNGEGPYVDDNGDIRLADLNEPADADLPEGPEYTADEIAQLAD